MEEPINDPRAPQPHLRPPGRQVILLVDNNSRFRHTCARNLELRGYVVLQADGAAEALRVLQEECVHLAVIDMRLRDDRDEDDETGLQLAKQIDNSVIKIIFTIDRNWQRVRAALSPTEAGGPPALYFHHKREGMPVLAETIRRAFELNVRVNWGLKIDWRELDNYRLARRVAPGDEGGRLEARAAEIEGLLRRLFLEEKEITIGRVLWQHAGRVAFYVHTLGDGQVSGDRITVCGRRGLILEDRRRFLAYAPKAQGDTATTLSHAAATTNFAANAYSLAGARPERVHTLFDAYRVSAERFAAAVRVLCERTLADWSQGTSELEDRRTLDEVYREQLAFGADPASRAAFEERVEALVRHLPRLGVEVERAGGRMTFHFEAESFSYPDPVPALYRTFKRVRSLTLTNTPGSCAGDTILTDGHHRAWLTDFARAGLAPVFWNHVEIEAAVRFDCGEPAALRLFHDLERGLTADSFLKFPMEDVEWRLRKQMRAVRQVRLLAPGRVARDPRPYHLAMLYQAAKRLSEFEPGARPTPDSLVRPAHCLMAAAMLCDRLPDSDAPCEPRGEAPGPRITYDSASRTVCVNGVQVKLQGQPATLFEYLYARAGRVCTRAELIQHAIGVEHDGASANLAVAIHRLRELIEEDPHHPKIVLTARGEGFRLALDDEAEAEG